MKKTDVLENVSLAISQQRYSQLLVYFLPFLGPGHLYAAGSLRRIFPHYIRFSMT